MSQVSTTRAAAYVPPADRLATLPEGEPEFTLGWYAIEWAEAWLLQPNGPRARQPFRFTKDQMRFLLWWYAMRPDGHWLFHHGVRRLAKGSGKSPNAAIMSLIELCAPVRLERKDSRLPGGCAGRPVDMPLVDIAATAESQTANTMRMVRAFAPKGSKVVEEHNLDPGKTVYHKLPEGTLRVITSSSTAAEGAESSFVVGDETEHWRPNNGGVELAAVLEDNLAKSGSRMLETSNAWVPGDGSVAEATWEAWLAQEEGRTKGEAGILYDARMAPADTDMADFGSLQGALQWVYGDCDWKRGADGQVDVTPIIDRVWSPRAKPSDSKRKYLNRPATPDDAWVEFEQWLAIADVDKVAEPGDDIALFFDGSKSKDATALVACRISDGFVFVPETIDGRPTVWEPDPGDDDDVVDVHDVDNAVDHIFGTYSVLGFFADVQEWESFTKLRWPEAHADVLAIEAQPNGKKPEPIAWDMRSRTMDFTRAAELVESEIADGLFVHDGNPILARHVRNCRRRPNRYGVSVGKESKGSPHKVDAAVCMIGARMVRALVRASPEWEKRERRKNRKQRRVVIVH